MDCTYKTNRYDMPLLNIVGITATLSSFNAAFVFLSKECEEDFVWALRKFSLIGVSPAVVVTDRELALMRALQVVFPKAANVLCFWHRHKNIVARCRHLFVETENDELITWTAFMNHWEIIVQSPNHEIFLSNWTHFKTKYEQMQGGLVSYIETTRSLCL
jgi:hypothetical protein